MADIDRVVALLVWSVLSNDKINVLLSTNYENHSCLVEKYNMGEINGKHV